MKPLTLGAGQLWVHMFPWKKWALMIYEINHIWTRKKKWNEEIIVAVKCNLCNCVKKPEKKFRTSTGFEPMTSWLLVRWSTNWLSYEATDVRSRSILGSYVSVKEMSVNDMNCGNEMKSRNDRRSETQFMQLRKEAWKKCRTSMGFEPVTSRLPVWCSTNWAMKPLTFVTIYVIRFYPPRVSEISIAPSVGQRCHHASRCIGGNNRSSVVLNRGILATI